MNLSDQITSELTTAMKSGDSARVAVLRLLKSAFKNEEIKLGHELNDEEATKVVQREAKQRRDSIAAYQSANRADLEEVEQSELEIISSYLPEQMDENELNTIVEQVITETGAIGLPQMGMVMGKTMSIVAGKADGGLVSKVVKEKLGSL